MYLAIEDADQLYSSKNLYETFGLDRSKPCADWYFHHRICEWIVEEEKSQDKVSEAIRQLENTVSQLKRIGNPVNRIQLKIKGFGGESRIYDRDLQGYLVQKLGRRPKRILIEGIPIQVIVRRD